MGGCIIAPHWGYLGRPIVVCYYLKSKGKKKYIGYIARALLHSPIGWVYHYPSLGWKGVGIMAHQKHPKQGASTRKSLSVAEQDRLTAEFLEKQAYLSSVLERVEPLEYYRDMFPEGSFEEENDNSERRPNGLASVLIDNDQEGRRYNRIIFDDLAMIEELTDKEFVVVPPVGYSGRRRLSKLAYCFYGMCIDLDDVGVDNIKDLLYQMENDLLPTASYIVNSGMGLHVVYLFEEPIPAFPQYFESLGKLKERLSDMVWNQYTSRDKKKQYQGIFQGYRMVGSPTKISDDCRVTAYRHGKKVSLQHLNQYVDKKYRCIFNDLTYTSLKEAREKWSEWYQRRIVENRPVGDYKLSEKEKIRRRAWYESWKQKLKEGAYDGNRHYCICILFNYAMKAEISVEEALEDALELVPYLNTLTTRESNEFTEFDVYCAMVYHDRKYIKMGRHGIHKMTKIDIGETKRNGQKQTEHLEEARAIRDIRMKRQGKKWTDGNGRPIGSGTAEEKVKEWRKAHPEGKKADCIRETGLSKPTVLKWWK